MVAEQGITADVPELIVSVCGDGWFTLCALIIQMHHRWAASSSLVSLTRAG